MKVFGISGWKNTGKTTLTERLVAEFRARGLEVSTIKHSHHDTDLDRPGTDSQRHRAAGAREVLLASSRRWVLMHELAGEPEPDLAGLLARLAPVDLVLVEGFRNSALAKLEVRWGTDLPPSLAPDDQSVRAVVQRGGSPPRGLPGFDPDDIAGIADFVMQQAEPA